MKKEQWLECTNPWPMLEFLQASGKASSRKLLLFGCACCREVWHLLGVRQYRKIVLVAERYADGQATAQALVKASREAYYIRSKQWSEAMNAAKLAADSLSTGTAGTDLQRVEEALALEESALGEQVKHTPLHAILRDIVGNPFHAATLDPSVLGWNDRTLVNLAQAIYDERAFDRLPVLADALEDAGCKDQDILRHCRGQAVHFRGCFVIDLLLGKE